MNKMLIISPAFAPCSAVGAARMTSLAQCLLRNGFMVTAISAGRWFFQGDLWKRSIPDGLKLIEVDKTEDFLRELYRTVDQTMKKESFDICLTSMGPFHTQRFLWRLCRKYQVPFVADYRDPWLFYPDYYSGRSTVVKIKRILMDACLLPYEYKTIVNAAGVVTVTDRNTEILQRRYPRHGFKMKTILNGHEDLSRFQSREPRGHDNYIIGCAGKFAYYHKAAAFEFVETVNKLNEEGINIKIIHVGEKSDDATGLLAQNGINGSNYKYMGKRDYDAAMEVLWDADAMLIVYGDKNGLGTKVFDYIGLNKPIVYYGLFPSKLAEFVSGFKNTVVAGDVEGLKEGLEHFVRNRIKKLEDYPPQEYSRDIQNRRYLRLIEGIIQNNSVK